MSSVPSSELTVEQKSELACSYAAMILHDEGSEISADNINKVLKAAGVSVEAYWPTMFCRLLEGKDLGDMLSSAAAPGAGGGGAAPAAAAAGGDAAPAAAAAPVE